ncbi:MAG: transporter [Thiotrichales bacterium]|nr:transporter [Thiotrichales bacterium]
MTEVNKAVCFRLKPVKMALLIGGGILSNTGWAQQPVTDVNVTNQLLMKLQERDQIIADLQRRVQQLEQHVGNVQASKPSVAQGATQQPTPSSVAPVQQTQAKQSPVPAPSPQKKGGAGSFEVDEEAAERALERTLVQAGALLLPYGQAEIQPFATYARRENEQPIPVTNLGGDVIGVTNFRTRRNEIDAGVFLRVGLPFETQAEFSLPARVVNQSNVIDLQNNESDVSNTGYALGDIRIGLAKTLFHEDGWLPDLVGRITWDTDSGKLVDNNVAMGTGFNELIVSATALKRQDPLAFTATLSYQKTFEKNDIEPGDQYGFSVGATLAASPQTSLSIGLQQSFSSNTKRFGNSIPGTDDITSAFTLGAASTIGRRLFFSTTAGIGLTDSAPDYFVSVAIPLRFDVPFKSLSMGN